MPQSPTTARLALIGFGGRGGQLAALLAKLNLNAAITAVVDTDPAAARTRIAGRGLDPDAVAWLPDLNALLARAADFDGLLLATRCNAHADMAERLAATGLPLFMEKPVGLTLAELRRLAAAFAGRGDTVVVSFPLRNTPVFRAALDVVRSGRLGPLAGINAVTTVPYGGVYFADWYRDPALSANLWLQKATHDLDCVCQLAGTPPTQVVAMESLAVYGGDRPFDLHCTACDAYATCYESPLAQAARGDRGGMPANDHACCYSRGITHHDSAAALLRFGRFHAVYAQNFLARRAARQRGATVIGHFGTLRFSFVDASLTVIDHCTGDVQTTTHAGGDDHFGGDAALLANFVDVVHGRAVSHTPLDAGLRSAAVCLAAADACHGGAGRVEVLL